MKRLAIALGAAVASVVLTHAIFQLPAEDGLQGWLKHAMSYLMVPGALFGLVASGFRVHDVSPTVMDAANAVFYFAVTFVATLVVSVRKSSAAKPPSEPSE